MRLDEQWTTVEDKLSTQRPPSSTRSTLGVQGRGCVALVGVCTVLVLLER